MYQESSSMDIIRRYYFLGLASLPLWLITTHRVLDNNFNDFFGFFAVVIIIISYAGGTKIKLPKYILPLVLLILYYVIWDAINGIYNFLSIRQVLIYLVRFKWLHLIATLLLIENTQFDKNFIQTVIIIFKITIITAFIVSAIQFFIDPFFLTPKGVDEILLMQDIHDIRYGSIFRYESSNGVGMSFIPIMSILIGFHLYKNNNLNILWILMAAFIVFATKSRYVYLNFFVILIQYPLIRGIQLNKLMRILILLIFTTLAFYYTLNYVGFRIDEFFRDRLLSESAYTRLVAIELFAKFFPESPYFGTGVHLTDSVIRALAGRSSQIHIGYLAHLYSFGIVGSIMLFVFWYMILRYFRSVAISTKYYGSLFAFITFLIANLTLVQYNIYHYGLLLAFVFNKTIQDEDIIYHS